MTVAELQNEEAYEKILVLRHDDILPFVQNVFSEGSLIIRLYIVLNILLFIGMLIFGAWQLYHQLLSFWAQLGFFLLGLTIGLLPLIPVHEGIHGIAYKLVGAPKVSYGGNLKQFYFYAVADFFVVTASNLRFIALAPFFVINGLIILCFFYVGLKIQWFLLGLLLIHTAACSGDFAMLGFYVRYPGEKIYTYDDVKNKISYFFRKRFA